MVLHFEQVNQFGHFAALLDDLFNVLSRLCDELLDGLLVCKHAVLVVVLEDSEVGLSRHEQAVFDDVDEAESEEVEGNMHEVGRAVGHQSDDVVTDYLTVHGLGDLFLEGA